VKLALLGFCWVPPPHLFCLFNLTVAFSVVTFPFLSLFLSRDLVTALAAWDSGAAAAACCGLLPISTYKYRCIEMPPCFRGL